MSPASAVRRADCAGTGVFAIHPPRRDRQGHRSRDNIALDHARLSGHAGRRTFDVASHGRQMFLLNKWYLDLTTADGTVVICYAARLRWGPVRVRYSSVLLAPPGARPDEAVSV